MTDKETKARDLLKKALDALNGYMTPEDQKNLFWEIEEFLDGR